MAILLHRAFRASAERLKARFIDAWKRSDQIFAIVGADGVFAKPIVWRHPFIFYVGHLPAFSWNQICGGILNWRSYNVYFDDLFCRGIDPDVDTGECHWHPEVPDQWPTLGETLAYRDAVRGAIKEAIDALPECGSNDVMAQDGRVFEMVLEHEYMHQETLLYMIQRLTPSSKRRPSNFTGYTFGLAPAGRSVYIGAGRARLGANFNALPFGWDNEFGEVEVAVPAFRMDALPVTNSEFQQFVLSGAYDDESHWLAEDWRWKNVENKRHPASWLWQDGKWYYRAMFDHLPLEQVASWPVYVSLAEARAYAAWRGMRLPTEAEFHRAAFYGPDGRESKYPWGNDAPSARYGNFNFTAWDPVPAGQNTAGASRWGVLGLYGSGWELTGTAFAPFTGFSAYMTCYPNYSSDFFDGKHYVLKGASWATDAALVRPSFRNWYQAHYPYVFAKFRCVSDDCD